MRPRDTSVAVQELASKDPMSSLTPVLGTPRETPVLSEHYYYTSTPYSQALTLESLSMAKRPSRL